MKFYCWHHGVLLADAPVEEFIRGCGAANLEDAYIRAGCTPMRECRRVFSRRSLLWLLVLMAAVVFFHRVDHHNAPGFAALPIGRPQLSWQPAGPVRRPVPDGGGEPPLYDGPALAQHG